jgi:hypothetical protein
MPARRILLIALAFLGFANNVDSAAAAPLQGLTSAAPAIVRSANPALDQAQVEKAYWHRYYWHRHYWHRHYWHRHYWHRHYWHRHYWHRHYWHRHYW